MPQHEHQSTMTSVLEPSLNLELLEVQPRIQSYEAHVTIEPVVDDRLQEFKEICARYRFKVADLVMVKDRPETAERSNRDSFCTGHSKTYGDMLSRMSMLRGELIMSKFEVWRWKIEGIVLDCRVRAEAGNKHA